MPIIFNESLQNATNLTTYTFTNMEMGTATPQRWVIIAVASMDGAAISVSSVTLAGVTATLVHETPVAEGTFGFNYLGLYAVDIGTTGGTQGNLVVTFGATQDSCFVASWTVPEGLQSATPTDDDEDSLTSNMQVTTTTAVGDYVVGIGFNDTLGSPTSTWTNLTEEFDEIMASAWLLTGATAVATAAEGRVIDLDVGGAGPIGEILITASFIPKGSGDVGNLVHQTSVTTGTGDQTLVAVNGKRDFSDQFDLGGEDFFHYFISNPDAAEWERGTGHLDSANVLVRDTVIQSSNSDSAVSFTAGTKNITNDLPALEQSGAWDLLETVVASNDATIDITGLSSKHFAYKFVWSQIQPVSDAVFYVRTDANGGASFDAAGSDYAWANHHTSMVTSSADTVAGDNADAQLEISPTGLPGLFGSAANEDVDLEITLFNPSGTGYTRATWACTSSSFNSTWYDVRGGGVRLSAALVDAVRFLFSTGNINTGTLKVYGLRA